MKKTYFYLIIVLTINMVYSQEKLMTIPQVQEWKADSNSTTFDYITIQFTEDLSKDQQLLFQRFQKELKEIGIKIKSNASETSLDLVFNTKYKNTIGKDDSYEITFNKKTAISASSYEGLLFSTRTLLQLFSQEKYKRNMPNGLLVDYPSYEKRMLLIDVARKFFSIDELKDFIKAMAWVKMNELHLHLSDNSWGGYSAYRLESRIYPELTAKDGHYSWEEINELQDYAHSYGITIVPEIDSPGHSLAFTNVRPDLKSNWLTPNYLDITNEDTYPFMEEILNEVIPHFDAPDFHLGTDEYRINSIKNDSLKTHIGETFRKYINHFNKVVRKHGKTTRIWSGFEHMPGVTEIDDTITIDMWETSDARDKSEKGYKLINSSHYYTYIVPGAPYYGVDDTFIYEKWTPEIFSDKAAQNLDKGSPGLLGSKMHIWTDFGPTGYSVQEIARLSIPSMMVFSEKMWGTKGSESFQEFKKSLNLLNNIPQTQFLERNFSNEKILYASKKEFNLKEKSFVKMNAEKLNVEYPWELNFTLKRLEASKGNEVILSSKLATVYSNLEHTFTSKKGTTKVEEKKSGFGIVRANQTEGATPLTSHRPDIIVFNYSLPLNQSVNIKLIGDKGKTSLFVNGKLISTENIQMLCPLEFLGSTKEQVFNGEINQIEIKELATKPITNK